MKNRLPNLLPDLRKIRLVLFFMVSFFSPIFAIDCASCGKTGIPELSMNCPACMELLRKPGGGLMKNDSPVLAIEIRYTGDEIANVPEYGKVYVNKKYRGNIYLLEKETRDKNSPRIKKSGLGVEYTAVYKSSFRDIGEGLHDVSIEFRFPRWFDLSRNTRRIIFENISMKRGNKTEILHIFASPSDFTKKKKEGKIQTGNSELKPLEEPGIMGIQIPVSE
ncbi:MAG: hypothetical protein HQM10_12375 [Candidatus Riflebacteria bacterium]|nr:hypothetical protein [Candidatus Riflebacteria bacterium]